MDKTDATTQANQGQAGGQALGVILSSQPAAQATGAKMPGFQQVQRQIADLRQTLQTLMMDTQYADGELVTASAALDAQLEDYYRTLTDKKQPGLRTF